MNLVSDHAKPVKLDLIVVYKIMPEEAETNLEDIKTKVVAAVKHAAPIAQVQGWQVQAVAYGLKALMVTVLTSDMAGGADAIEEALGGIEGVGGVTVEQLGRV